ncbi:methyltransferase domain-containing protein [Clostridium sp. UBA1056]|uniref:MerR family transcriptional regulator n=1 Tax=unclassified Clostridium TaxID=2614128 RepID=UPI0032176033
MDDMYTIREVAELFNITTNKVRFYEKRGLLNPLRDVDNEYRKFNHEDIMKLQSILLYRSIGLSIKDVRDILKSYDNMSYLNYFNNQWEVVNDEIHRLSTIRKSLENIIDKLYEAEQNVNEDILYDIGEANKLNDIKNNWRDKWNFNNWARTYDKSVSEDRGELKIYKNYQKILQRVYELADSSCIDKPQVLEIGVGTGNLASKFLGKCYNIVGVDQSREMLCVAKEKYPKLKVRIGEFLKIPYGDRYFDIIVSTYAFHHLNEEEKFIAIEEMIRVLKSNGKIILGDLMFKNKAEKANILKSLSKEQVEEIEDEYYSNIDFLKKEFERYNKNLSYEKIDMLNYIIQVS